jgi:hypothetical protein
MIKRQVLELEHSGWPYPAHLVNTKTRITGIISGINEPLRMVHTVHSVQMFVTALSPIFTLTNSNEGASVGVGIAPRAYPDTAEMTVARADNHKRGPMILTFGRKMTRERRNKITVPGMNHIHNRRESNRPFPLRISHSMGEGSDLQLGDAWWVSLSLICRGFTCWFVFIHRILLRRETLQKWRLIRTATKAHDLRSGAGHYEYGMYVFDSDSDRASKRRRSVVSISLMVNLQ